MQPGLKPSSPDSEFRMPSTSPQHLSWSIKVYISPFFFFLFLFFNHYIFLIASLLCLVVTFIFKITTNTERKKRTETSQWKEGELSKTEHLLWTTCSINWSLCWTFFLFIFKPVIYHNRLTILILCVADKWQEEKKNQLRNRIYSKFLELTSQEMYSRQLWELTLRYEGERITLVIITCT